MGDDFRLNFRLARACTADVAALCKGARLPRRRRRDVLRLLRSACLRAHAPPPHWPAHSPASVLPPPPCPAPLAWPAEAASTCEDKACHGVVMECLREHVDQVAGEECKAEVMHSVAMQVG